MRVVRLLNDIEGLLGGKGQQIGKFLLIADYTVGRDRWRQYSIPPVDLNVSRSDRECRFFYKIDPNGITFTMRVISLCLEYAKV